MTSGNVERAGFAGHVRVKQDLQQQIAQFFRQILGASLFDCVENFVGLLDQVGSEGYVGLLAVPGAAAGGAQAGLDGDQIFKEIPDALPCGFCGDGHDFCDLSARRLRPGFLARLWAL